jgi:hypothetical protein
MTSTIIMAPKAAIEVLLGMCPFHMKMKPRLRQEFIGSTAMNSRSISVLSPKTLIID